jgi:hypothetical protein
MPGKGELFCIVGFTFVTEPFAHFVRLILA